MGPTAADLATGAVAGVGATEAARAVLGAAGGAGGRGRGRSSVEEGMGSVEEDFSSEAMGSVGEGVAAVAAV